MKVNKKLFMNQIEINGEYDYLLSNNGIVYSPTDGKIEEVGVVFNSLEVRTPKYMNLWEKIKLIFQLILFILKKGDKSCILWGR